MNIKSQTIPLQDLTGLAGVRRQSVLIEGAKGYGKTYLAKQYANMLGVDDFIEVSPKVNEIRSALDECSALSTNIVLCIENLDLGLASASYTILKALEEPAPNLFIVITCRNIQNVPDTIVSRTTVITLGPPTESDLFEFGNSLNPATLRKISELTVWKCCNSLLDVSEVLQLDDNSLRYYESLTAMTEFRDSVSSIAWNLSHFSSGQPCNIELSIRCIMNSMNNPFITSCGIECLRQLSQNRIASHAILSKFAFNVKYCE